MAQLIKTIDGLAIASCKTRNGLAIASVKTVNGLDNTSGGSSITLVQSQIKAADFIPWTNSFGSNVTAGNLLIIGIEWAYTNDSTILTVTDSLGNVYTISAASLGSTGLVSTRYGHTQFAYCVSAFSGACTVTVTPSAQGSGIATLIEATAGTFDQTAAATGTGTAVSAGSLTTPANGCFGVAIGLNNNGAGSNDFTVGAGWTLFQNAGFGVVSVGGETEAQAVAGGLTGNFTAGTSGTWCASIITFKP